MKLQVAFEVRCKTRVLQEKTLRKKVSRLMGREISLVEKKHKNLKRRTDLSLNLPGMGTLKYQGSKGMEKVHFRCELLTEPLCRLRIRDLKIN